MTPSILDPDHRQTDRRSGQERRIEDRPDLMFAACLSSDRRSAYGRHQVNWQAKYDATAEQFDLEQSMRLEAEQNYNKLLVTTNEFHAGMNANALELAKLADRNDAMHSMAKELNEWIQVRMRQIHKLEHISYDEEDFPQKQCLSIRCKEAMRLQAKFAALEK